MRTVLAAPDLTPITTMVWSICGTLIGLFLVVRMTGAYSRQAWGEMGVEVAAVIVCGFFVWDPPGALTWLQGLAHQVGGLTA